MAKWQRRVVMDKLSSSEYVFTFASLGHVHTLYIKHKQQKGVTSSTIALEENGLFICLTCSLYMSSINCGFRDQNYSLTIHMLYIEIIGARILFGQRL